MKRSHLAMIAIVGTMLIGQAGFDYYLMLQVRELNEKLTEVSIHLATGLSLLNSEIAENRDALLTTDTNLRSMGENLSLHLYDLDQRLIISRESTQNEFTALNAMMSEIEKQSVISFEEVRSELKSIKVKSTDFTEIIDEVLQSTVSVRTERGFGSGAVIRSSGYIITNFHVIDGADQMWAVTHERDILNAELVGYNRTLDIAVLKVDQNLKSFQFADSDKLKVGQRVIALGNPAGLSFTVTEGIISSLNRKGPNNLPIYIQTDVPINPGNSGGPLVDTEGRIIGLNNFKIGGYEGLGFALNSNVAKETSDHIIRGR